MDAVVAWRDGRPVGAAHAEVEMWSPESRHAEATILVPRDERRTGVGTALYRAVSRWAVGRDREGLDIWFDVADPDAVSFWANRGFEEVGRERISYLDLRLEPGPAIEPPDGVTLVTLADRADLEEGMYRVGAEAIADIPAVDRYDAGDFARWRNAELGRPGLVRDCSVVALADEDVVGYSVLVRFEAKPEMAEHENDRGRPCVAGPGPRRGDEVPAGRRSPVRPASRCSRRRTRRATPRCSP